VKPGDSRGRALLHTSHVTRLRYLEPVVEAYTEVRMSPVDTDGQRVVTAKLEVEPAVSVRTHTDYFGSRVSHFNVLAPHGRLEIRAESVVETSGAPVDRAEPDPDPRPWRQRLSEYLGWSPSVPALPHYGAVPHRVSASLPPADFVDALRALGADFRARFRYDPGTTDVHSSPQVLFESGGGVCQDLAHAMIGVLRLAGVACRYVSGYVFDPAAGERGDHLLGAGASHAWVQAWHPELGWLGIDPTNNKLVDWQYVRVAAGRDYTDVQPLRGVFVGAPGQSLSVEVRVARIG
jgi:transglutaminase-like putative cysteine protease